MLEVLVTFQQRFRDETSDMLKFPDIYPDVDRLSQKHGQGIQIRRGSCSVCHKVVPSHSASLPDEPAMVGGEARTRGCGLPSYTRNVELAFIQTCMKDFTHIPPLCGKGLLISWQRVCESLSEES